jgi:two-component system, chemotaxis family, sensor kinase Cph1
VLARRGVPLATGATVAPGGSARVPAAAARSERNIGEMRDLALVFSHDLKEPLQQIMRLARRAQAGEEGGPRAHASLQQMLECAARASTMLDATLEYLSVTARDDTPSLVDLNVSLERALENLRGAIDEAGAEIVSEHLPTVSGDEVQLLHLFQNLIANALKFRGRERPLLRITVTQQDQDWLLAFRDNGIGIAQVHAERIFEMGQRLHTRDEFPGSGIGLALCKRIVERLGGRIWVESADGAGATFYILLPRAAGQSAKQT